MNKYIIKATYERGASFGAHGRIYLLGRAATVSDNLKSVQGRPIRFIIQRDDLPDLAEMVAHALERYYMDDLEASVFRFRGREEERSGHIAALRRFADELEAR